ncbi:7-aminocholesterol resistance [Fusarium mundagurra]|uniref:7-aminocholesterol resistance n=1 Tax=Fusarium mundagurra TaxID=1567541 RepID=A0A8H6DAC4_9HYPO|nr:7-aminocholesterol resistance [Fusarium mundagurra]
MSGDGPYGPVVNGTQIVFFEYLPNKPAAISFVVLFGIATLAHLIFLFIFRAWFFIPFILGGICEIFGYFGRAQAHDTPDKAGPFILQNVLLLAGTPFLAATIYMSLRRVATALDSQHLSFISLRWLTKLYVLIDIACIVSQFIGAIIPASGEPDAITKGRTILIAGLIVQLCALSIFILTSLYLYIRIRQETGPFLDSSLVRWRRYFRTIEAVTVIMIIRSIVRAVEYLQGQEGFVISHEVFIYLFDASLMFLVMVLFLIVHPGRLVKKGTGMKWRGQTQIDEAGEDIMHLHPAVHWPIPDVISRQYQFSAFAHLIAGPSSTPTVSPIMFALRRIIARPMLRVATRQIHVTPRRFASADQPPNMQQLESMMNDPHIRETFEKLSRHPPAIEAMQKMGDIIKSKGLATSGPPSKMDIMKLMMDKEFRDAAMTLTTEMQNAGVEINPDVFMKMMQGEK